MCFAQHVTQCFSQWTNDIFARNLPTEEKSKKPALPRPNNSVGGVWGLGKLRRGGPETVIMITNPALAAAGPANSAGSVEVSLYQGVCKLPIK